MTKLFLFYRILSHVFVFQEQSSHGLCEHFDDELWAELFAEFRGLYPYAPIPDKISNLFLNIVNVIYLISEEAHILVLIMSICRSRVRNQIKPNVKNLQGAIYEILKL